LVSFDEDKRSLLTHLAERGSEDRISEQRNGDTKNEGFLVASIFFSILIMATVLVLTATADYNHQPIDHVIYSDGAEYSQHDRVYASDIEFLHAWNQTEYSDYCETLPDEYGGSSTTCHTYTTTYLYLEAGDLVVWTSNYNMLSCLSNSCSVVGIVDHEGALKVLTWR
jgi:hypothetical protein